MSQEPCGREVLLQDWKCLILRLQTPTHTPPAFSGVNELGCDCFPGINEWWSIHRGPVFLWLPWEFLCRPRRFWPEPGHCLLNCLDSREFPWRKVKIQLLYNAGRFLKFIIREELCEEDTVVAILTGFLWLLWKSVYKFLDQALYSGSAINTLITGFHIHHSFRPRLSNHFYSCYLIDLCVLSR